MRPNFLKSLFCVIVFLGCNQFIYSQNSIEIVFQNPINSGLLPFDSTWTNMNIVCELHTGWIEPIASFDQQGDYHIFGGDDTSSGKFKVDFNNFDYKIDSVHFDVFDACNACFFVTMYDQLNGDYDLESASIMDTNEDTLYYYNNSPNNPDSLVMETWEGGFRKLTIFYSNALSITSTENGSPLQFQLVDNKILCNPSSFSNAVDVMITDLNGKQVMYISEINHAETDINHLSSGIYLITALDHFTGKSLFKEKIAKIY